MFVSPTHIVAAAGVTLNADGKILMVKTFNSGWVFPGGQVENGETVTDAVIRETMEESGVTVEVDELFCVASNTSPYTTDDGSYISTKVMFDFICHYVSGEPGSSDETSESGWFTPAEALELIQAPAVKARFRAYLEHTGRVTYMSYVTRPEFRMLSLRTI